MELEVVADERAAAQRGSELIAAAGKAAVEERGIFGMAMSGGRTPWAMLALLGTAEGMPWGETELFQVDERIAAPGSEERNLTHLVLGLSLEHQAALRPMPVTQRDLDAGAREYESSLPGGARPRPSRPRPRRAHRLARPRRRRPRCRRPPRRRSPPAPTRTTAG